MTSATDLITYIGVPLTVAGVLPLLWNMVLAIHIWLKLKKSIPLRYRAYYSLLPDPAAGKVTVVARIPSLELPGLWSTKAGRNGLGKVSSLRRNPTQPTADHATFLPIGPALSVVKTSRPPANDDRTIISFHRFKIARQRLLGRTWMALADRCGLVLGSPQDDEDTYGTRLEREEDDEVRFSVESDMNANAPTPLRMNWAQFVWLSLALGVSPHDSAWNENYPFTLKDSKGHALVTLFENDGQIFARVFTERDISYSLSRAFAWHNIILERECLWPLGWQFESRVPLSSVQISPGLSRLLHPENWVHAAENVLRGKEAQDCEDPLTSACRWMLYHRRHRGATGDSIPMSQQMLEFRERTLCHLHLLEKTGRLEEKIQHIFRTPPEPQDRVATGDEKVEKDDSWRDMEGHTSGTQNEQMRISGTFARDQTNAVVGSAISTHEAKQDVSTGDEKPALDHQPSGGEIVDDRNAIPCADGSQGQTNVLASASHETPMNTTESDTGHTDSANGQDLHFQPANAIIHPQSTSSTTGSSSGPAPTKCDLPAHVDTKPLEPTTEPAVQLTATQSKAASGILDAVRSALAASTYVKRFEMLLFIQHELLEAHRQLSEFLAKVGLLVFFGEPQERAHQIERALSPALAQLAKFSAECNKLETLADNNAPGSKTTKWTDIYELLPRKHRVRLEDAVLAKSSSSSLLRPDDPDDVFFVASVALATADWDTVVHRAWRLNVEATDRIQSVTSDWRDRFMSPDYNKVTQFFSQRRSLFDSLALVNHGLYKAPESSELDALLKKEFRKVSLL